MHMGRLQTFSRASLLVTQLLFGTNFGSSLAQDPALGTGLPHFWVNIGAMPIKTEFKVILLMLSVKQALGILTLYENLPSLYLN